MIHAATHGVSPCCLLLWVSAQEGDQWLLCESEDQRAAILGLSRFTRSHQPRGTVVWLSFVSLSHVLA